MYTHTSPGLGSEMKDETNSRGVLPFSGQYAPYAPQLYDEHVSFARLSPHLTFAPSSASRARRGRLLAQQVALGLWHQEYYCSVGGITALLCERVEVIL